MLGVERLTILLQFDQVRRVWLDGLGICLAETHLQLTSRYAHLRERDVIVAVEVDDRVGLGPAALPDELLLRRRRLRHGPGHVARITESFGPEPLTVADEQIHGGGHSVALGPIAHGLLVVG